MSNPNRQPQGTPTGGQFAPDPVGAQAAPVEIAPANQRGLEAELQAVEASMKRAGELRAAVEVEEANAALCHIAIRARMAQAQAVRALVRRYAHDATFVVWDTAAPGGHPSAEVLDGGLNTVDLSDEQTAEINQALRGSYLARQPEQTSKLVPGMFELPGREGFYSLTLDNLPSND